MATFLNVPLSAEEELMITSVIVKMADGRKISEADVLHELIKMAQSHDKLKIAQRELKKQKYKGNTETVDEAYSNALDLLELE